MKNQIFLFIAASICTLLHMQEDHGFHTRPDLWEQPRLFQTQMEEDKLNECVQIHKVAMAEIQDSLNMDEKILSPNQSYWYMQHNIETASGDQAGSIYIYNERSELIKLTFTYYANFSVKMEWINEKLLYLRIWKGRVLAVDLIFDVENESLIYHEFTHDGTIPFIQWQEKQKADAN